MKAHRFINEYYGNMRFTGGNGGKGGGTGREREKELSERMGAWNPVFVVHIVNT